MQSWEDKSEIEITFLGGLGEVGMNCFTLETEKEFFMIDCGVLFSDLEPFSVDVACPNFGLIHDKMPKFSGIILTHGHEDHIGALPYAVQSGLEVPLYASPFTAHLIREKLRGFGLENSVEIHVFRPGDTLKFESISIQTIPINHSIIEACSFVMRTPAGVVVHTSDFRIDDHPEIGSRLDSKAFEKVGNEGVRLLLADSTNIENPDRNPSESELLPQLEALFLNQKSMTLFTLFSSNIGRVSQLFRLAEKHGKKVALCGRGVETYIKYARESGYLASIDSCLVSIDQLESYRRKDRVVLVTGSQGEYRSVLARVAMREHPLIHLEAGDRVVYSSKPIPGNEVEIGRVINRLFQQGIEVLYRRTPLLHVSGHATRPELKEMHDWVRPQHFTPVHGEHRHLFLHRQLAVERGMRDDQVSVVKNGDCIHVTPSDVWVEQRFEDTRWLIDSTMRIPVSRDLVKKRRRLGESGLVTVVFPMDSKRGKLLSSVEIRIAGLLEDPEEAIEALKTRVQRVYQRQIKGNSFQFDALSHNVRLDIRRYFKDWINRKPEVQCIMVEI